MATIYEQKFMENNPVYIISSNDDKFRFVRIEPFTWSNGSVDQRFLLEEWCPVIGKYVKCLWCSPLATFSGKDDKAIEDALTKRVNGLRNSQRVIVYGEYDEIYSANTTEEIGRVCVYIIKQADESGFFESYGEPKKPDFNIDSITNPILRSKAEEILKEYKRQLRFYEENEYEINLLEKALAGDYIAAYTLCEKRSGSEYENFEIKEVNTI